MEIGKINKRKGSNAEKLYATKFKELGFNFCNTSSLISKKHDNANIDLMNIPFNLQIKAGKQKNMNAGKELFAMYSYIHAMFPIGDEVFKKPLLLVHYEEVERGHKRLPEHEKVYMSLLQFDLFKENSPHIEYDTFRVFKYDMYSEFKTIVSITFEVFKNEIILKNYIKNGSNNNTTE